MPQKYRLYLEPRFFQDYQNYQDKKNLVHPLNLIKILVQDKNK